MKPATVFIIPYFGKLPSYFDAFILSIAGKNFDVFFFSDAKKPDVLPLNCRWHPRTFSEMQLFFSEQLNMRIEFRNPKKLCDFKPALGWIFRDYISAYTFWGSVDLDTCLGNFDKFLPATLLNKTDVFSGIKEYLSGSFFIIRNNEYCNNLFKKSKDWQQVFSDERNMIFDECGGSYFKALKAGKTFREINPPIESFTEVLFKENKDQLRLTFQDVIAEPRKGNTMVDSNCVLFDNSEYLLVHHIYYKAWYSFFTKKKIDFPFYINRLGFFRHKPSWIVVLFSKNFRKAVSLKIQINLKKILPGA